jgi:hypothetical protein
VDPRGYFHGTSKGNPIPGGIRGYFIFPTIAKHLSVDVWTISRRHSLRIITNNIIIKY